MSRQKNAPDFSGARGMPRHAVEGRGVRGARNTTSGKNHISVRDLFSILTFIDATDRETWLKVGMGIKLEFGEAGRDYWLEWSMSAPSYNYRDAAAVWRSFKGGKVSFATVIFLARQGGWRPAPGMPKPTREEIEERNRQAQAAMKRAEIERARERAAAALQARELLDAATLENGGHAYLVKKRVGAHGIFSDGFRLLVPMRDIEGKLWNAQRIDPRGNKRFLRGGRVTALFHRIGRPVDQTLVICEGYATGATLHESTGHAVAVAFNCNNLKPVAKALRAKYPEATLIIAADNDRHTPGNPGVTKANEAALAVGGRVAVPEFPEGAPGTDFNDLARIAEVAL